LKKTVYYKLVHSAFGSFGIVWHETDKGARIVRIFLPDRKAAVAQQIKQSFLSCRQGSCPSITGISEQIAAFLAGEPIAFDLNLLDFSVCSAFQKKVLLAEAKIPRGRVSTYGRLAAKLGIPAASRAVGHALAQNPFPPVIPCHRTVRSDGALGGFQGGLKMKRELLEQEGITFSRAGNAVMNRVFY
jgi:methylated-DNA-[protein]-cysteine S-methyltransferase